jgi:integrase
MFFITMTKPMTDGLTSRVYGFCGGEGYAPEVLYAQAGRDILRLVGEPGDRACHERPKYQDAALIVASGWLRDGLPGRNGERRKAEAAFDLDGILRSIRKAELDGGAALAANLLSATTGMRQSEVLAVRGGDIGEAILNVAHSWSHSA